MISAIRSVVIEAITRQLTTPDHPPDGRAGNPPSLWLDPAVPSEADLLNRFMSSMEPGSNWMGWWPDEGVGIAAASRYGIATIASDWATNLTSAAALPVRRVGEAEDVAQTYLYLMRQGFGTGQSIVVDGGAVLV